jgi:hypothetical protein
VTTRTTSFRSQGALRASSTFPPCAALVAGGLVLAAMLGEAGRAEAQGMNVSLNRLRVASSDAPDSNCPRTILASDGVSTTTREFCGDDDAWRTIAEQLGTALIPPLLTTARSHGPSGFGITTEGWITGIASDRQAWRRGTEGDATSAAEGQNRAPSRVLFWQRLAIRKAFPAGLQLGTSMAHLYGTDYWALGLDIQWSLFEGFRRGPLGFVPDLAVRGAVNTLLGEPEFNLTVPSVEVVLSKRIAIAGVGTLTPFVGGQLAWIFGDSELVDLTPDVDALRGDDKNNNYVFRQVRSNRTRLHIGFEGHYRAFVITGAVAFDLSPPPAFGPDAARVQLPRQWTGQFAIGAQF